MAASTAFNQAGLINAGTGDAQRLFYYVSTDAGATVADTSALGSYFSSAYASFRVNDMIFAVTSTVGMRALIITASSSTGVTVAAALTSTGATL